MFKDKKREEEVAKGVTFIQVASLLLTAASIVLGIGLGLLKEDKK